MTEVYEFQGKKTVLTGKCFQKYVDKTNVDLDKTYSVEEAEKILNEHVHPATGAQFKVREPFTGKEICELLGGIDEKLDFRLYVGLAHIDHEILEWCHRYGFWCWDLGKEWAIRDEDIKCNRDCQNCEYYQIEYVD